MSLCLSCLNIISTHLTNLEIFMKKFSKYYLSYYLSIVKSNTTLYIILCYKYIKNTYTYQKYHYKHSAYTDVCNILV